MTWSVRGIDDEVRETALAAARRSGKPVGEWLNEVIRDISMRQAAAGEPESRLPAPADTDIAAVERQLGALADRLSRLSAGGRPSRARANGRVHESLDEIAAELDRHMDVPGRAPVAARPTFVEDTAADRRLQSMLGALDALDRRLARLTPQQVAPAPVPRPAAPAQGLASTQDAAPRPAAAQPSADDLTLALHEIGRRQRALDPDRDPGPQVRAAARPVLASDMERHFRDLTARLDALAVPAAPPVLSLEVETDLRALRSLMEDGLAARVGPLAETVEDLRGSLARIEEDIARLGTVDTAAPVAAEIARLRRDIADSNPDGALRALELGYGHVVERLDDLKRGSAQGDAVARLAGEIADLRTALAEPAGAQQLATVENKISALSRRIDQLVTRRGEVPSLADIRKAVAEEAPRPDLAPLIERVERLAERQAEAPSLADIRKAVAEEAPRADYAPLASRFDALDTRIEVIHAVETRLGELIRRFDQFEIPDFSDSVSADRVLQDIALLHKRIERLSERPAPQGQDVTGFEQALAEIVARLEDIGGRISLIEQAHEAPRAAHADPAMAEIAGRLDSLADTLAAPSQADALVAAVEDKFARIARHLDAGEDRFGALGAIEDSLVEIQQILAGRAPDPDATHAAAREAVAEFVRLTREAGPDRAIGTLVGELQDLKDATRGLESRTADSLKAVQEALTSVAGLLHVRPAFAEPADVVPPPRRATVEDNRPLEPGSGKPSAAFAPPTEPEAVTEPVRAPVVVPEAVRPDPAGADAATPSRRADFIAAARRAAQAAQAARLGDQAAPVEAPGDLAGEHRPGALARIGAALRGRGKPIAAIAAAIVLAGLATQLTLSAIEIMRRPEPPVVAAARPAEPVKTAAGDVLATGSVDAVRPEAKPAPAPLVAVPADPAGSFSKAAPAPAPGFVAPARTEPAAVPKPAENRAALATPAPAPVPDAAVPARTAAPFAPLPDSIGPAELRQAAISGDAEAGFEIGLRYADGRGVPVDDAEALGWFRRSAEAGFVPAQYRLARSLERGVGAPRDMAAARRWYQAAAEKGNVRAMHNLGVTYANEQNIAAALPWFQKAADFGLKDSQFNLGIVYSVGSGVKQDFAVAYNWFTLAADQGDPEAARMRDNLAQYLDKSGLAAAKMAAQTWRVRSQDRAANDEATRWTEAQVGSVALDSIGERVARAQSLLKDKGLYAGKVDGKASADTRTAVKAYQKKVGLRTTGEVDDALIRALTAPKAG